MPADSNKMFQSRKPGVPDLWCVRVNKRLRYILPGVRQNGPGKAFNPSHAAPMTALTGTLSEAGM